MDMNFIPRAALAALVAAGCLSAAPQALAQSAPALGCYIDTPAWDVPTEGGCNGIAPPQRTLVFETMHRQTPYNRYTYTWVGCTSSNFFCIINNANSGASGRDYTVSVVVYDTLTGLSYPSSATARLDR